MGKLLSVSIAAYNVQDYLEECLESFTSEAGLEKCEVLIIDDGSTDKTSMIACEYEKNYPNTYKVIKKKNGGWGSTVNLGIEYATGKYFKQLDGDDRFEKEMLHQFLEELEKCECDMFITPFITFEDKTNVVLDKTVPDATIVRGEKQKFEEIVFKFSGEMHACTFKTSLLKDSNINITEHSFYTDVEYMLKACCKVDTAVISDTPVYCYRVARSGQSVSIEGIRKHYKEHLTILKKMLQLTENEQRPVYKAFDTKRVLRMIIVQYNMFLCLKPSKVHKRELMEFDRFLKEKYLDYYNIDMKKISLLRNTNFIGYQMVAKFALKKQESTPLL